MERSLPTKIMESEIESSVIIMEIGRSSILFCYKVRQGRRLPTQHHGESKRKLCHHHGDQPLVDSIFTRCIRGTAFLPNIMESPRGSSVIIMEISHSSILLFYKVCQGRSLPTQHHGELKRELCHHHGDRPLVLILLALFTGTSSLEPLLEGLFPQIHNDLS